jgi:RNA polymerase sigma-70 factor (ECF subfamily)
LEETELIQKIKSGEKHLFEHLIKRYEDYVYSICINSLKDREDAKDIAQDTFYKAYKSIKSYDGTKSKFSTWIYRIAYNRCIDFIRKKNSFLNYKNYIKVKAETQTQQEHSFQSEIVTKLLSKLPAEESAMITLYYFDDMSIKEISYITKQSESYVKVKLHRIRKKLKEIAKKEYNNEL